MKKKLSLILLITIISFFSVSSVVFGDDIDSSGQSSPGTPATNHKGYYALVTQGNIDGNGMQAFRLSAYKIEKNGSNFKTQKIGHSIDIIQTNGAYSIVKNSSKTYRSSGVYSKIDYISKKINLKESLFANNNKNYIYDLNSQAELKGIKNALNGKAIFGSNVDKNYTFRKRLDDYFSNNQGSFENIIKFMNNGNSVECEDGIYLFAEPLTLIGKGCTNSTNCKKWVMGTFYELTIFAYNDILNKVIRKNMAKGLYINGSNDKIGFIGNNAFIKNVNSFNDYIDSGDNSFFHKKQNYGYGLNAFWTSDNNYCTPPPPNNCVYTNSNDFKLNAGKGEDVTINGVTIPYCCTQFPDKPNLVEDHPECGYCPETTAITLVDKDKDTGDEINSYSNNVGINDASDRCSVVNNGNEPNSKWGRTSGYEIKDQLTGGIENNACLPITSDSSDGNSSTLIKKKLNGKICYVTCVENDNFNIPSNPLVTTTTSHFVWPTSPATNKLFPNNYPLTATGNITCRIIVNTLALNSVSDKEDALKKCTQNLSTALSDIDSFNPEISLYQNGDYSNEYKLQSIDEANPNKVCNYGTANNINTQIDCDKISSNLTNIVNNQSNIDNKVKAIREHRFSITKTMSFELDSELNNYVVKSSNKSTSIKPNPNFEPYIVVGYGNIPINVYSTVKSFSYNETASVDGNLDLRFRKISNHFKDTEVSCLVDYTAHAAGPGDNTTNYYCRPGTKRAGWNISSCVNNGVINNNCVIELCSSDEGHACSWFTDNPGLEIDNNDWDNIYNYYKDVAHKTNDIAKNLTQNYFDNSSLCSRGTDGDDPECPEDSQKPNLNISSCVKSFFMDINSDGYSDDRDVSLFQQIVQGTKIPTASEKKATDINNDGRVDNLDYKKYIEYNTRNYGNINSIDAAKTICYKVEKCYKKTDKLFIVRSIDLNNPFPSITGITGDDVNKLGRLPGYNWRTGDNLEKTTQAKVNAYITNNRGVETNEVYKKTPLYTFELNASTIKKIREYNHSIDDRTGKRMDYETYHLDCTNSSTGTHDRECISEFVHNTRYGFIDNSSASACNSIEKNKFYDCLE